MSIENIILERNKEFDKEFLNLEGLYNTESGWVIREDPKKIKDFNHHSNILLIEEVIRELEGMKMIEGGYMTVEYGNGKLANVQINSDRCVFYNQALDEQISSLTKSLEEIKKK